MLPLSALLCRFSFWDEAKTERLGFAALDSE